MARYLDPKIDLVFKRIFVEHAPLLKSFLNALLPLPADAPIDTLTYLPSEQVPQLPGLYKNSVVDVKCTDTQGRIFIVEMQMMWSASFKNRMLFNAAKAYVGQLPQGFDYTQLHPVYALALINAPFTPSEHHYHHFTIVEKGSPDVPEEEREVIEGLQFVFIELPKFKAKTEADRRMRRLWLRFLSEINSSADQHEELQSAPEPEIQQALELAQTAAYSPAQLATYDAHLDSVRLEASIIKDAKLEGLQEGFGAGKIEGKLEGARNLLPLLDDAAIAKAMDLSLEQVQALRSLENAP